MDPSACVDFLELVGSLKVRKRTGWVRKGIQLPESLSGELTGSGCRECGCELTLILAQTTCTAVPSLLCC